MRLALSMKVIGAVMWPFSSKKKPLPVPGILAGETSIRWNNQFHCWEFTDGEYDYLLAENPEFDIAVLNKLGAVRRWLADLDHEIGAEIKKHLEGWCEWNGEKHVVEIDISRLVSDQEIDISYADGDQWGDLGITIVITDGRITSSSAGD